MAKKETKKNISQHPPASRRRGAPGVRPAHAGATLRRLISYIGKRKWRVMLALLMTFVSTGATLGISYLLRPAINDYILPGNFEGLAGMIVRFIVIALVGASATFIQSQVMARTAQATVKDIRQELFSKLQALPIQYFDQHTHGSTMSLFTNDIDTLQQALEQSVVQLLSGGLVFVGSTIALLALSPLLFLVTLVMLGVMLVVAAQIGKRSGRFFKEQQNDISAVNSLVEEMMDGQRVVKVFNHEKYVEQQFDVINDAYRQSATMAQTFAGIIMPTMNNLNNANFAMTAIFGGVLTLMGRFDVGSLVSYLQFARNFTQPIQQVTNQMNNVLAALAGAERIFQAMDEAPELDEGNVTLVPVEVTSKHGQRQLVPLDISPDSSQIVLDWAWKLPKEGGDFELIELKGDVRFYDVAFGYNPEKKVLKDMSLYAKPGQKIAFVGSTGAGKTTITNLINRFYDIQSGQITYDGIDIKDIKKADLRRSLGMVLQDTHLFTGTIADNIRYGRLHASDGEVQAAARMSSADGFIRHLPEGYDTVITGDGENLSQGQRQLLSIARAAVANPPVLILDEATSSIDTRTEKLINEGMDALMQGRTVFVIAHRLSTVRDANAILVIEDGRIIERGDHDELLAQKGRYYELYTGIKELS